MKRKNVLFMIFTKYGIHILFIICTYLTIRWSDLPSPGNKFIEMVFVHENRVDSAALNTVTGYITGYIVYVLTVLIPDVKKKRPVRELVMRKLTTIYSKSIYILLLMCKNCCAYEKEWFEVLREKDIESFNGKFIEIIKRFDVSSEADTAFLHKKDRSPLKWYEYLYEKYEEMYKELDSIFLQYQYYLNEEDIEIINILRYSEYFALFTGKGEQLLSFVQTEKDNYGYYEEFPVGMFYEQENRMLPIFADNNNIENCGMLKAYIMVLKKIHDYLREYKRKYGLDIFHEDYASSKLKEKYVGHLGTAIFRLEN